MVPGETDIVVAGTHSSQTTGYARVMKNLVPAVARRGVNVAIFGIQSRGPSAYPDVKTIREDEPIGGYVQEFDAYAMEKSLGLDENGFFPSGIAQYVDKIAPKAVVLYNDPVVVGMWLEALEKAKRSFKVFLYLDLVSAKISKRHWDTLRHPMVTGVMTFSECWSRALETQVPGFSKPTHVVPHSVNVPKIPRDVARAKTGLDALGEDVIFLNMNRNTQRKRLDLYATAAARFFARNPHAEARFLANSHHDEAYDLHSIMHRELVSLGVGDREIPAFLDRLMINRSMLTDEFVDHLHNACDVGVNCAEGEGWGLCAAETASVGTPVIVSNVGGMGDVFSRDSAYVLDPKAEYWIPDSRDDIGGTAELIDVNDLVRAFEELMDPDTRLVLGRKSLEKFAEWPSWDEIATSFVTFVT